MSITNKYMDNVRKSRNERAIRVFNKLTKTNETKAYRHDIANDFANKCDDGFKEILEETIETVEDAEDREVIKACAIRASIRNGMINRQAQQNAKHLAKTQNPEGLDLLFLRGANFLVNSCENLIDEGIAWRVNNEAIKKTRLNAKA